MIKELVIQKIDAEDCLQEWMEKKHYDFIVDEDCDLYSRIPTLTEEDSKNEDNIIFKLRKNVFTPEEQLGCYDGLIGAARVTENRGIAAGKRVVDQRNKIFIMKSEEEILSIFSGKEYHGQQKPELFNNQKDEVDKILEKRKRGEDSPNDRGNVWLFTKLDADNLDPKTWFVEWAEKTKTLPPMKQAEEAKRIIESYASDTSYANSVMSGIAGYFDRYPRIPYGRPTTYTEQFKEDFEKSFPYLMKLDKIFKKELPERYTKQRKFIDSLDPRFSISDTVFTTITVNRNFRTAAHRDAGDFHEGFSNLSCVSNGKSWGGGYLVLPEYRVAINLRPGDLLLINNHAGIHGNTELEGEGYERVSVVCYAREKMKELGSWDYENLRRQFVEENKNNKEHKFWRPLWNGIFPGWEKSEEWFDYLEKHNLQDQDKNYKDMRGVSAGLF